MTFIILIQVFFILNNIHLCPVNRLLGILALLLWMTDAASQEDSLRTRTLGEVVITGQYDPQSVSNSLYHVRVIPMETIQARGAVNLQDVLKTELNMRFSQDATLGGSRLSMQGLSGQNIKILIDGVPMSGRQGTSNAFDINQINVHTIERIEIVEGPMSTMYGSDALAGVINIITKKSDANTGSVTVGIQEQSVGNEYGWDRGVHNQNLGGTYARDKFRGRLDIAKNHFGGWQGSALGREKLWKPKDQIMASGMVGLVWNPGEIYYRLDYLYENIYDPGAWEGRQALDRNYITNRFMHQLQITHTFSDRLRFTGVGSYTHYTRKTRTVTVDASTGDKRLALGAGQQDEITTTAGMSRGALRYRINNRTSIRAGFDINIEAGRGNRLKEDHAEMGDYALFGSVEWKPLHWIQIRPGFRIGYNSVYKAPPFMPALNTRWILSKKHYIRFSYGYGFRAPSLRELYFDFFDSSHSLEGNTNLKAEVSHSVNIRWNGQVMDQHHARWSIAVGGFYNAVKNKINYGQKPGSSTVLTYINVADYQTQGFTLNNRIDVGHFQARIGFSYTGILNHYSGSLNDLDTFFWSPEITSTLTYKIPKPRLTLSLYYKYTGQTPLYETLIQDNRASAKVTTVPTYQMIDFTVQKNIFKNFMLTAGVYNLCDVTVLNNLNNLDAAGGIHAIGTETLIGYGRSYSIMFSYRFATSKDNLSNKNKTL